MNSLYPDDIDSEGFLFYPIEYLLHYTERFSGEEKEFGNVYIFGEYMHESW